MTELKISAFWPARPDENATMPAVLAGLLERLSLIDDRLGDWGITRGPTKIDRVAAPIDDNAIRRIGLTRIGGSANSKVHISFVNGREGADAVWFMALGGSWKPGFSLASRFLMWLDEPRGLDAEQARERIRGIVTAIALAFEPEWVDVTTDELREEGSGERRNRPGIGPILYLDRSRSIEPPTSGWASENLGFGTLLWLKGWRPGQSVSGDHLAELQSKLETAGALRPVEEGTARAG